MSRGDLIRDMWVNVREKPLTGIGFGIASRAEEMVVIRERLFGLPVGASIEKGVMPIAVLEEIGIPGFVFVSLWVVMLLRRAAKNGLSALAVVLTALFLNMGEYTFYSPGGLGLIVLVLLGWAVAGKERRIIDA